MKDQLLIDISHPVLRDHQVDGRPLLPGLGYVDLLYQTFREHGHDHQALALRNLSIHHPLTVGPNEEVLLTIEWRPLRDDAWEITVDGDGRRHATAQMHRIASATFDETVDLEAVRQSARTRIDANEIYEGFRRRGLVHGGFMKAEGALYVTEDALYVDVAVGDEASETAESLMFHPALIDGSAVMAGGFLDPSEQRLSVPLFFESFRASALLQRRCMARIPMSSVRRRSELSYLTMELFNEAGRKVAELKDLACREIRQAEWIEMDQPATPRSTPKVPAIAPGLAVDDTLRRLLADRLGISAERIHPDRTFAEMGLVSGDLLDLARVIESWIGQTLSPALLFEYTTVAELSRYLEGRCNAMPNETRTPLSPAGNEGIAIVGMSGRFPRSANVDQLWDHLVAGTDCITEVPAERWDHSLFFDASGTEDGKTRCKWGGFIDGVAEFDPLFFNISPGEARMMDPQGRLFLETTWNLLESSGHTRATLQTEYRGRVGVYVGSMYQHYTAPDSDPLTQSITSLSSYSAIANRVSHFFGLYGPSIAVDTMCSSSMTAIHMACKDLMLGECELAIAGGVNLSIHPKKYVGLSQAELIGSHADSRSFGQGDGYLPAETVGAVLLKPLSKAIHDGDSILAVIRSSAINHGGRANGYTVPNPNAQAELIEELLAKAGVDARTVSYVEAAANGSQSGDLIEIVALSKVFGKFAGNLQHCAIGSVKSNIGHAEAASGISQLVKVVRQLERGMLVPSIKADAAKLDGTPFYLQTELQEWKRPLVTEAGVERECPRRAIVNSFGAGGAYASLLVEEHAPLVAVVNDCHRPQMVVFSARTEERLQAVVFQMLSFLNEHVDLSLEDLAYTLQARREAMEWRLAMVVGNREELASGILAFLSGTETSIPLFTGQVDEWQRLDVAVAEERSPEALARLWTAGAEIQWRLLHEERTPRIVPLPTYPFLKERHWLPEGAMTMMRAADVQPIVEIGETVGQSIRHSIASFLSRVLDIPADQIQPNRNLRAYGMDSIVAMRLARALAQQLAIPVTGRALFEHQTIDSLSAYLEEQLQNAQMSAQADDLAVELLEQFKLGVLSSDDIEALILQGAIT